MNIYVGNLSYEVTEEDLKEAFKVFGEVETVRVFKRQWHGQIKRHWSHRDGQCSTEATGCVRLKERLQSPGRKSSPRNGHKARYKDHMATLSWPDPSHLAPSFTERLRGLTSQSFGKTPNKSPHDIVVPLAKLRLKPTSWGRKCPFTWCGPMLDAWCLILDKTKQFLLNPASSDQHPASAWYWQKHLKQKLNSKFKILAYKDT